MVCDACLNLLKYGVSGQIYNICSGDIYSVRFVIETLTKLTGHSVDIKIDPLFVRKNEVAILQGAPQKLNKLVDEYSSKIETHALETTLLSMLEAHN